MLPMSCGPSMLPSGHRALCSRLSLCGLCVPFSCGKTDYCRCAGRWGWSLAHLVLRLCLVQWAVPEGRPPTWLDVWPIQAQGCCWPTGRWGSVHVWLSAYLRELVAGSLNDVCLDLAGSGLLLVYQWAGWVPSTNMLEGGFQKGSC